MRCTRRTGKGSRNSEYFSAILRQSSIEVSKANIITDRQAEMALACLDIYHFMAGPKMVRFSIALAIANIRIKHVDFIITGNNFAMLTDQKTAISHPVILFQSRIACHHQRAGRKYNLVFFSQRTKQIKRRAVCLFFGLLFQGSFIWR